MSVYIGIDWSESKHDVVVRNELGAEVAYFVVPHTWDGFELFDRQCCQLGLDVSECVVGIETAHNLIVDHLWDRGYGQVYVIPPALVNSRRSGQRPSGARNDHSDAALLSDILRKDLPQLHPWRPDSVLGRKLRAQVRFLRQLSQDVLRGTNRLRSVLQRYYPAALEVFGSLDAQITLHFIQAYPTPQAAAALGLDEFVAFTRAQHYTHPNEVLKVYRRLQGQYPEATAESVLVYQDVAAGQAERLLTLVQAEGRAKGAVSALFWQHPDASLFASLPGVGNTLGPALLAHLGDDRERFPTAASLQAVAGTCPVTKESGKQRQICFRYACDHDFRDVAQNWAYASLQHSPWAKAYYEQVYCRGIAACDALRRLANRWLAVLWTLWQRGEQYDEARHMADCLRRSRPRQ